MFTELDEPTIQTSYRVLEFPIDIEACVKEVLSTPEGAFIENTAVGSEGEICRYSVLDRFSVDLHLPSLSRAYTAIHGVVRQEFEPTALLSPFERSAYNLKRYQGPESGQGLHYDSNPISGLLMLTYGSPFQIVDPLTREVTDEVETIPGRLLIFRGKNILHRVPSGHGVRITFPCNYYLPDDMDRPDWIDEAIYENKDYDG